MGDLLLRMTGVSKSFGATLALRQVSLEAHAGEVLALIGENGAGKSTLMKVLAGAHPPDRGVMEFAGRPYVPAGPQAARMAGVAMIYQELNLAPDLSVLDNIMLGQELQTLGWVRRGPQLRRARQALELLGHADLPLDLPVRGLSTPLKQIVEIARALAMDARLIVFDEPTSSLARHDVENLFTVVRKLKQSGRGVIYISHFLEEVRRVADRYVVLRDGAVAGGGDMAGASQAQIIAEMVGRGVNELFPQVPHAPGEVILSLAGLSGRVGPKDVSFELRRGEILGIAGLIGAGRTELLRCLYALDPIRSGELRVAHVRPAATPRARIQAGLGMVSEDRKTEGLSQDQSIADNLTLSRLAPYSRLGFLSLPRRQRAVGDWMARLQIKSQGPHQPVRSLSGGNQQKGGIAGVLHQDADVLLLDEPTRGIDVGAKAEIYQLIGSLAAQGKAIVFVSSYLPELLAVCDRVGVMSRGRLQTIRRGSEWTEESLLQSAIGEDLHAESGAN